MTQPITAIQGSSASSLLRSVLSAFVEDGPWERSTPRGMPIRERRHAWYRLTDTTRCAAWLPFRRLNYSFMAAEFLWIFGGRDDVEMISYYNKEIAKFSDDGKTFFGAYGPRWRAQIGIVIENLKRDPDSRQAVVQIFRPEALTARREFFADDDTVNLTPSRDVPCTLSMQYFIRNGLLEVGVIMRSSDAWLGLPYDIFNFSMLQRCVAAELKVKPGSLTLYIGSSHLYERNLKDACKVLDAERAYYDKHGTHPSMTVEVPDLPGIDERRVMKAEEACRRDYADADVDYEAAGDWRWVLDILAYRKHKNKALIGEPWWRLVEGV